MPLSKWVENTQMLGVLSKAQSRDYRFRSLIEIESTFASWTLSINDLSSRPNKMRSRK